MVASLIGVGRVDPPRVALATDPGGESDHKNKHEPSGSFEEVWLFIANPRCKPGLSPWAAPHNREEGFAVFAVHSSETSRGNWVNDVALRRIADLVGTHQGLAIRGTCRQIEAGSGCGIDGIKSVYRQVTTRLVTKVA